jgi:hypothetical protein
MEVLFTKSDKLMSQIITGVTHEPVSHCAIHYAGIVAHSSVNGVELVPYSIFKRDYNIVLRVELDTRPGKLLDTLDRTWGHGYDIPALLFLGLRYLAPCFVPKQNLWAVSGMYICTEFVTDVVDQKVDSMCTPYQLYLRLTTERV